MSLNAIAKKHPQTRKLVILWNMASELESEPAIEYAIKLYLLLQINGYNKNIKDPMIEKF